MVVRVICIWVSHLDSKDKERGPRLVNYLPWKKKERDRLDIRKVRKRVKEREIRHKKSEEERE